MLDNKSESFAPSVGNELTRNFKNFGEPVYVNVYHLVSIILLLYIHSFT